MPKICPNLLQGCAFPGLVEVKQGKAGLGLGRAAETPGEKMLVGRGVLSTAPSYKDIHHSRFTHSGQMTPAELWEMAPAPQASVLQWTGQGRGGLRKPPAMTSGQAPP